MYMNFEDEFTANATLDEKMHFNNITYMTVLLHKNPWTVGLQIYKFDRPFLSHNY